MSAGVLITGAATGIGRATVIRLAHRGFTVFAGVRKPEDGEALVSFAGPSVTPLILDVTDSFAIAEAAQTVERTLAGEPLLGLVNNAGVAIAGPIEVLSPDDWQHQFEVNLFGPIAMIRTFLPLLRRRKGRIVNVSSISGKFATAFSAPYASSKAFL